MKTVSLETSKLLKEKGFRQDTQWYWIEEHQFNQHKIYSIELLCQLSSSELIHKSFAAPTTDELLEELPCVIVKEQEPKKDVNCWLQIDKTGDTEYLVRYVHSQSELCSYNGESLPEALAQMWLWLKSEGLLEG